MAIHVKADGKIHIVQPKNGTDFSLEELQGYVNGYIEIVRLPADDIMVVNENGLIENLPQNGPASVLANQHIVGDVLICRSNQVK